DACVFLRIPAIVKTFARSGPRGWIILSYDFSGDACRLTYLTSLQVTPNPSQHDGLSISVFRCFHFSLRLLGQDLVRDPAIGAEAANFLQVQVVQLLEEPCLLLLREVRQEVWHR